MTKRAVETVLNQTNNNILKDYHHSCQKLTFDRTIFAHEIIDEARDDNSSTCVSNKVAVMLQVKQNRARFDARVILLCDGSTQVVAYPIRIKRYRNTAYCVHDEFICDYCYCH